jgi:ABC-type phosphate/phosphonate transport system substrate-binding protein
MPDIGTAHVANARMYAVTPAVRDAWRALFDWTGKRANAPLSYLEHAAPAPLEALWRRDDLALAFICGYPFARRTFALTPVAVPIPSPPRYGGRPVYCTDFVVRADSPIRTLSDAFGGRIGWTVEHSQSGFNAVRHHLLRYRRERTGALFRESVGPLVTPRRVIEALMSGAIDVGPLDSYVHDLLKVHEPATVGALRTVETTVMTPMPLLVASAGASPETIERLRDVLVRAGSEADAAELLRPLLLTGFDTVEKRAYDQMVRQAQEANEAGYPHIT